jgi:hypothetical protein
MVAASRERDGGTSDAAAALHRDGFEFTGDSAARQRITSSTTSTCPELRFY